MRFILALLLVLLPVHVLAAACGTKWTGVSVLRVSGSNVGGTYNYTSTPCSATLGTTYTVYSSGSQKIGVASGYILSPGQALQVTNVLSKASDGSTSACGVTLSADRKVDLEIVCNVCPPQPFEWKRYNETWRCGKTSIDPNSQTCQSTGISWDDTGLQCWNIHKGNFIWKGKYYEGSFKPDGTANGSPVNKDFPGFTDGTFASWELTSDGWQRCIYDISGKAVCGVPGSERPDWWPTLDQPKGGLSIVDSTSSDTSKIPTDGTKEVTTTTTASDGSSTTKTTTTVQNSDGSSTITDNYARTLPDGQILRWSESRVVGGGSGAGISASLDGVKGSVDGVKGSVDGLKGSVDSGNEKLDAIKEQLEEDQAPALPGDPSYNTDIDSSLTQDVDWSGYFNTVKSSPFIGIIEGNGVSFSGSQCSVSTTVYGRNVNFSICDYASTFSLMGQFVVACAAIYGIFIVVAKGD